MPYDDEFFSQYYPAFRSISPNTKKTTQRNEILKDLKIKTDYDEYILAFKDKSAFYRTYKQQGKGHKDMWQLLFERIRDLIGKGGIISVLIPSQILSNDGSAKMREKILDSDIHQMYVFENRRKIFPIDSRYRFVLLTMRNTDGPDAFKAGFYLHDLSSLETAKSEEEKIHTMSKEVIRRVSPDTFQIPEVGSQELNILAKMSGGNTLSSESDDGWSVAFSSGFNKTNDADLLKDSKKGWPVLEGRNIHQFNHTFARPEFTTPMTAGLKREGNKRVYRNDCRRFYHSFRLVFRRVARSTDMRTIIASIIPPQRFHTHSVNSIVLTSNGGFERGNDEYNRKTAHLCGILNSMAFDFVARAKLQVNTPTAIRDISFPSKLHHDEIAKLTARLSVGSDEFEGFAESLRVANVSLTPPERIHATARLDALVAHAYGLTREEYQIVLDSFKFTENPALLEAKSADLNDNKTLRQFYGEVRKLAPGYYDDIVGGGS